MAGPVRHPIDVKKLEDYLRQNVPEIELPLEIKQVRQLWYLGRRCFFSSAFNSG